MKAFFRFFLLFLVVSFSLLVFLLPGYSRPSAPVYNTTQGKSYTTIQEAIDEAHDGDRIVVYPGTYQENIDFKGKSIILQSTDPDHPQKTIIDGGGNGPVVTLEGEEGRAVSPTLRGFTIQNGSAEYGGGIYIENSSASIEKNIITGNYACHVSLDGQLYSFAFVPGVCLKAAGK